MPPVCSSTCSGACAGFSFEAGNVSVKLEGLRGDKAEGTLVLYAEDQIWPPQPIVGRGHRCAANPGDR